MVKCAARQCNTETQSPSTFFRFPSTSFATRRSLWVKNSEAKISPNDNECFLCPKHFGPKQFRNRSLRWDAIPDQHLPTPEEIIIEETSSLQETKGKKRKRVKAIVLKRDSNNSSPSASYKVIKNILEQRQQVYDSLLGSLLTTSRSLPKPSGPSYMVRSPSPLPSFDDEPLSFVSSQSPLGSEESPPHRAPSPVAKARPPPTVPTQKSLPFADIVDFEAEIDRLSDPLHNERPVKKKKDEDVRTKFTEEDDIPLHMLLTEKRKANTFNTPELALPPRQSTSGDATSSDSPKPPAEGEEPESILGDTISYSPGQTTETIEPEPPTVSSPQSVDLKLSTTTSDCYILCSNCDFYASSEEKLKEHEKECHSKTSNGNSKVYPFKILTKSGGVQFYLCDFCSFSGNSMDALVTHMVHHFPKEDSTGLSIQKYNATVIMSSKNVKNIVVNMNGNIDRKETEFAACDEEIVEVKDQQESDTLGDIVITNVTGGKCAAKTVNKLFPKPKWKLRSSTRKK